jgi:lysozyme
MAAAGLLLFTQAEGYSNVAYPDPATGGAPWTICWGHTGPEVHKGLRVSLRQCEIWLQQDIAEHKARLAKCIRAPVNQNEADAISSLALNNGTDRICKSTLVRKLNSLDYDGAAAEFPKWVYANGKPMKGLVRRRACEQKLFLTDPTGMSEAASVASVRACWKA